VSEGKVREKARKYISCAEIVQGAPQRCSILHLYGGGKKNKHGTIQRGQMGAAGECRNAPGPARGPGNLGSVRTQEHLLFK